MIAEDHERNDVAIHWPRRAKAVAGILRSGRCPSHAVPRKLRAGGLVALVATDGEVLLLFRLARIEENVSVIGSSGQRFPNGCVLVARRGTVRRPRGRDPRVLNVNRHAPGAFAYFDARTFERVVNQLGDGESTVDSSQVPKHTAFPSRSVPFFANNIGKRLSQPERQLLMAYVKWVGDVTMSPYITRSSRLACIQTCSSRAAGRCSRPRHRRRAEPSEKPSVSSSIINDTTIGVLVSRYCCPSAHRRM